MFLKKGGDISSNKAKLFRSLILTVNIFSLWIIAYSDIGFKDSSSWLISELPLDFLPFIEDKSPAKFSSPLNWDF